MDLYRCLKIIYLFLIRGKLLSRIKLLADERRSLVRTRCVCRNSNSAMRVAKDNPDRHRSVLGPRVLSTKARDALCAHPPSEGRLLSIWWVPLSGTSRAPPVIACHHPAIRQNDDPKRLPFAKLTVDSLFAIPGIMATGIGENWMLKQCWFKVGATSKILTGKWLARRWLYPGSMSQTSTQPTALFDPASQSGHPVLYLSSPQLQYCVVSHQKAR